MRIVYDWAMYCAAFVLLSLLMLFMGGARDE